MRYYEAKAEVLVRISFDDFGMSEGECLKLATDIVENGDGNFGDVLKYYDLKLVAHD